MFIYFSILHYFVSNIYADAACTWPEDFVSSTWVDSLKGEIVFETSTMTGWPFEVNIQLSASVQELDTWECVVYDTSGPYLIMKTVDVFTQFITEKYTGYRCIRPEKITEHSYRYYQQEPIQTTLDYERVSILPTSTISDPTVLCTHPSSSSEFQVMIRKGFEALAKVPCPFVLLSDYTFTYYKSDGTVTCDPMNDVGGVNMCTDITEISVQPPACSSYPFYTSGTSSWCVDVVTVQSDIFISLYNAEHNTTVANTFQFVCVSMNSDGSSLSVSPQHCKANQASTDIPLDNSGAESGAVWNLSPVGDPCPLCPVLSNPFRGSVNISTNGAVTMATYTCDDTYSLRGNETRICQTNGEWTDSEPSCACPLPGNVLNGNVDITNAGLTLSFACDAGFVLVGTSNLSCNTMTHTWSDEYPTCVLTASSTNNKSTSDILLPAVIALAVIVAVLGIALGLTLFYIWKLKKKLAGIIQDNKIAKNGMESFMLSSSPPRGHAQHIMDLRNTSSAMSAPLGYVSSPRVDSVTPRSLSSSRSNTSLHRNHLKLIHEETVILDQNTPAPWSRKNEQTDENRSSFNTKSSDFPQISENGALVTLSDNKRNLSNKRDNTRKKKLSFGKKIQRQNSAEANQHEEKMDKNEKTNDIKAKSSKITARHTAKVSSFSSTPSTGEGIINDGLVVPKLKLSEQPQRASTPVKHHMDVNDPRSTPRSNIFTTVQ